MPLLDDFEARFVLGMPAMDRSHREMAEMIDRMAAASNATFVYLYPDLVSHTRAHFAMEEVLMQQNGYPGAAEHKANHDRVRGELDTFGQRLSAGHIALARAYVTEQLPAWFALHIATMDSALAAHVAARAKTKAVAAPPQS